MFTRIWLALFGQWSWDDLPVLPPELMFLPRVVPAERLRLGVLGAADDRAADRRQRAASRSGRCRSTWTSCAPARAPRRAAPRAGTAFRARSTAPCTRTSGGPCRPLRRAALRRAAEWIVARQEADGSLGRHPAAVGVLADRPAPAGLRPRPPGDAARASTGSTGSRSADEKGRRLEACQSPVWDTVLAMNALRRRGPARRPPRAASRPADWLLGEEIRGPGDWAVRRPDLPPGGWAFEFDNDVYPDTDDTAEVDPRAAPRRAPGRSVGAADRARRPLDGRHGVPRRRLRARSTPTTPASCARKLPFCDFGAVIDPPSADVTAHVVEALAAERPGRLADACEAGRGVAAEGAGGRRVLVRPLGRQPRLRHGRRRARARRRRRPAGRRPRSGAPCAWLEAHQNDDGGWGEDLRSYRRPGAGSGAATRRPSQTAWALLALLAAGERSAAVNAASAGWSTTSARTAPGTRPTSPAPASPATSTSTTTSTGWSSRSAPLGRYVGGTA